jgi:hypothetical protein
MTVNDFLLQGIAGRFLAGPITPAYNRATLPLFLFSSFLITHGIFMPPLSAGDLPARLPVVILYAETRGFTRMSVALPPATVLERIAEFF